MSSSDAPKPVLPPIVSANLATFARVLLTSAAGILVQHGLLAKDGTDQFVSEGVGVATVVATFAWGWWTNRQAAKRLVAAAATGVPTADPKSAEVKAAVTAAIMDPNSSIEAKS